MNIILIDDNDISADQQVILHDHRFQHIKQVLRATLKDTLSLGKINGMMGKGIITEMTDSSVSIDYTLHQVPPPPLQLSVILALPRPKMLKRILRNTAELGIKNIYLINSYKVEKSYWQTPILTTDNIHQFFLEGLSQAKDTILPKLHIKKRFKPFVEDELSSIIAGKEAFVAHPYATKTLPNQLPSPMPPPSQKERVIAIGPESGFIDYEVNLLQQQGLQAISMGNRIYRVENALTILTQHLSGT